MNESTIEKTPRSETARAKKPGFLGRIFQKLDRSLKQKADEQAQQGSCCGGSDGKGGKCC